MRAGLSGQAVAERRIEMQQKSGSCKELVMSVCPITAPKATKDIEKQ